MNYPLRHISIRVPWHDMGWDGRVCAAPRLNGSCLKLTRIAEDRDDTAEEAVKRLDELPQAKWPACAAERMGFMAPIAVVRMANHPYNRGPETSPGHFKPTPLRHPRTRRRRVSESRYSALAAIRGLRETHWPRRD